MLWAGQGVISLHCAPASPSSQLCSLPLPPRCLSLICPRMEAHLPAASCRGQCAGPQLVAVRVATGHVPGRWHALVRQWRAPRCLTGFSGFGGCPAARGAQQQLWVLPRWACLPGPSTPGLLPANLTLLASLLAHLWAWLCFVAEIPAARDGCCPVTAGGRSGGGSARAQQQLLAACRLTPRPGVGLREEKLSLPMAQPGAPHLPLSVPGMKKAMRVPRRVPPGEHAPAQTRLLRSTRGPRPLVVSPRPLPSPQVLWLLFLSLPGESWLPVPFFCSGCPGPSAPTQGGPPRFVPGETEWEGPCWVHDGVPFALRSRLREAGGWPLGGAQCPPWEMALAGQHPAVQ